MLNRQEIVTFRQKVMFDCDEGHLKIKGRLASLGRLGLNRRNFVWYGGVCGVESVYAWVSVYFGAFVDCGGESA